MSRVLVVSACGLQQPFCAQLMMCCSCKALSVSSQFFYCFLLFFFSNQCIHFFVQLSKSSEALQEVKKKL